MSCDIAPTSEREGIETPPLRGLDFIICTHSEVQLAQSVLGIPPWRSQRIHFLLFCSRVSLFAEFSLLRFSRTENRSCASSTRSDGSSRLLHSLSSHFHSLVGLLGNYSNRFRSVCTSHTSDRTVPLSRHPSPDFFALSSPKRGDTKTEDNPFREFSGSLRLVPSWLKQLRALGSSITSEARSEGFRGVHKSPRSEKEALPVDRSCYFWLETTSSK